MGMVRLCQRDWKQGKSLPERLKSLLKKWSNACQDRISAYRSSGAGVSHRVDIAIYSVK